MPGSHLYGYGYGWPSTQFDVTEIARIAEKSLAAAPVEVVSDRNHDVTVTGQLSRAPQQALTNRADTALNTKLERSAMSTVAGAAVVVGADGSECSLAAVRSAATDAVGRGRPLRIVHAFIWAAFGGSGGPAVIGPHDTRMRADAERILAKAVIEAKKAEPGVQASTALVNGNPAAVLLNESRNAVLMVIGDRGLGGFHSLLVGSVALHITAHAACPVLVVRGRERATGPVVVGVDGSAGAESAIGFAIEHAARRKTGLIAVLAWGALDTLSQKDVLPLVPEPAALEDEMHRLLSESLAGWTQQYPDVAIRHELVRGRPAEALIERSEQAQLLVTGARGRGGFAGLLLGSVSQSVLHHAWCPVAIVRASVTAL